MDIEQFREKAKETIEYICRFKDELPNQDVCPGHEITPNYMRKVISCKCSICRSNFDKYSEKN